MSTAYLFKEKKNIKKRNVRILQSQNVGDGAVLRMTQQ